MKNTFVVKAVVLVASTALLLVAANADAQTITDPNPNQVISWNLDNNGTLFPSDLAGVAPAYNWVNSSPDNPTIGLTNNAGVGTTLDLGYGSFNTWSVQGSNPGLDFDGTLNKALLNGYLNSGPAGWNPPTTNTYISFTNVPYARYDVIVYFNSDASGRRSTLSDGTTTYYFSTMGSASISGDDALFRPTTQTDDSQFPSADFAFFPGLTTSTRTFTTYPKSGNDQWLGIAGFQIIESSNVYVLYGPVPATQTVPLGQPASFSVMVGGETPAIQWRHNNVNIPDATNATYEIASTAAGMDGDYDVVVSNGFSSMTSSVATLTFYEPKNLQWTGNGGGTWDSVSASWTADGGSTDITYTETDNVILDPLGSFSDYIFLDGPVSPSSLLVSNATYTLSSASIEGGGSMSLVDNATVILETTDNRSGWTMVGSGSTLQVGVGGLAGVLGSGALTNDGALVFDLGTDLAYGYPIYGSGNITNQSPSGLVTLGSDINGNVLAMAGSSQLLLQGSNTLSGGMTISSGQVWARSPDALGGSMVTISGGELQLFFGFTYTGTPVTLSGGFLHGGVGGSQILEDVVSLTTDSEIDVDGGNSLTLSHPSGLAGASHLLTVGGGGTLILTGTNNTWGAVSVFSDLQIGDGGATGSVGAGPVEIAGTLAFNLASDLVLANDLSGSGTVSQEGSGTVTITAQNTGFFGTLVVSNGTLLVNGSSGGGFALVAGGTLGGTGTIGGGVDIQAGGTLAPGASVGTLTIDGDLTIGGTLAIEVNTSLAQSNDVAMVGGFLSTIGTGAVNVSNLGPALQVGDTFFLFNQAVSGGSTLTITGGGATWNNNLETDGSISVAGIVDVSQPHITATQIVGTYLVISGTNGVSGGTYQLLSSTNAATPLASWTEVGSGNFDASGSFSVADTINPNEPQRFYLLQVP